MSDIIKSLTELFKLHSATHKCVLYIWLITAKHCWTAVIFIIILRRPWSGLSFQSGSGLSRTGSPFFCTKLCSAHATSSLPHEVVQLCAICSDLSKQTYTTLPHYTVYLARPSRALLRVKCMPQIDFYSSENVFFLLRIWLLQFWTRFQEHGLQESKSSWAQKPLLSFKQAHSASNLSSF